MSDAVYPTPPEAEDLLGRLRRSLLEERTFVRLTLTNDGKAPQPTGSQQQQSGEQPPQPSDPPVDKLVARLIEGSSAGAGARGPPRVQVVYTHPTSTTTKTLALEEAPAVLAQSLGSALDSARFKASRLFTTEGDWVLERGGKGGGAGGAVPLRLYRNKATFSSVEVGAHDRAKKRRLGMPPGDGEQLEEQQQRQQQVGGFLEAYGILDGRGQPKKGMRDKHRQIERFVEILEAQLRQWDSGGATEPTVAGRKLRLLDAGCGRGLLTFAAFEYLRAQGYEVEARGIDIRPDVVAKANAVAASLGYSPQLTFLQGSIAGLTEQDCGGDGDGDGGSAHFDVVIALHACDTASDDAMFLGLQLGAGVILASPCCHKEVRKEMKRAMQQEDASPAGLAVGLASQAAVLRHGILLERTAEAVTDAIRALCLETQGYRAQVFEWINDEATSKNLMLTATKRREDDPRAAAAKAKVQETAAQQLRALLAHWGLRSQHLARLLGLV